MAGFYEYVSPDTVKTTVYVSDFQGDGTTTSFTLTANPFSENNTQVYIDGVYQEKTGYSVLGTVLTFSQAPPNLSGIEVTMLAAEEIKIGTTSADLVSYTPAGAGAVVTDVQTELRKQSASDGTVYTPAGTGAVATTVQAKLRESVSVKDFGADSTGSTSSTLAIQAAIDTGKDIFFPEGNYLAQGLTVNNNQQSFIANGGHTRITKDANGTIISGSGDDLYFGGIDFRGNASSFTGDNISLIGNRITFSENCGSSDAHGRALKATGGPIRIYGGHNTWATTATGVSDYDIEIGVSGTATLYHYITGVRTGQTNGGILLVDCGSQTILGCQIGKLNISKGTGPSGTNGGMVVSNRCTGDVTVGLPNCNLIGNQFSTSSTTVAFLLGTSSCYYMSNSSPLAITNAGNANNHIYRDVSSGSLNQIKLGPDTNTNYIKINTNDHEFSGLVKLQNDKSVQIKDSAGSLKNAIGLSASDDWTVGADTGANYMNIVSGSGGIYFNIDGAARFQAYSSGFRPSADNAYSLGTASQRFSVVYAGTGTINTSDAREKTFLTIEDAETSAALEIKANLRKFKFNDAIESKGDGARIHFGASAQQVGEILTSHGLTPEDYAFYCYDEWEERQDEDGNVELEAGNRYGIRYDELLSFIIAAL
jgi:hypothetical protein